MSLQHKKKIRYCWITITSFFCVLISDAIFFSRPVFSQITSNVSSGNNVRTSVSLSNTMGVYNTIDVSPNVEVINEASLVIKPGSTIQDSFGDAQGALSGNIVVTPGSANVNLSGLSAKNNYIIDQGTNFSSTMRSLPGTNHGKAVGSTSVGMRHDMTLTIDQTTSSFSQSFSQSF